MIKNFDVIVCTLKRGSVLKKCIESILRNNIVPDRLIIVDQNYDNLSILSVKKIFNTYNYKNYLIIKNISKKSLTASKNIALKYIQAEYVFFLDDDISIDRYFFSNCLSIIFKKKCTGVCGIIVNYQSYYLKDFLYYIFNYFEFRDNRSYFNYEKNKRFKTDSKKIYHLPGGITCFKSSIFRKISFDQDLIVHNYEDVDFNYRLKKKITNYKSYICFNSLATDLVRKNLKENLNKRFFYMRLLYLKHKNIKFFLIYYLSFFGLFLSSLIKFDLFFINNIFKIINLAKKKNKTRF